MPGLTIEGTGGQVPGGTWGGTRVPTISCLVRTDRGSNFFPKGSLGKSLTRMIRGAPHVAGLRRSGFVLTGIRLDRTKAPGVSTDAEALQHWQPPHSTEPIVSHGQRELNRDGAAPVGYIAVACP